MKLQATIVISYRADSFGDAGDALDDVLQRARERDDVEIDSVQLGTPASAGRSPFHTSRGRLPRRGECRTRCPTANATVPPLQLEGLETSRRRRVALIRQVEVDAVSALDS
jgi:hypothetical protein